MTVPEPGASAPPPAAIDGDGMLAEVIPPEAIEALDEHFQALKATVRKRLHAAANWIRMAICNALGITYAMRQLNARIAGTHQDIEHLARITNENANILKRLVEQTNTNTRLLAAFERGYPVLGKIAAEMRAREAKAAKKVVTNGKIAGSIVGADGQPIQKPRREQLLEEVRKNFAEVFRDNPTMARHRLYLEEIIVQDGRLVVIGDPDPDEAGGVVVEWLGQPLSVDDVLAVKAEQKRLLEERTRST